MSKTMADTDILLELDQEQRDAATAETNVVVAAGAGSGKTKVLAARYAWLVMERKYRVGEILTLTFTNKAANTMYSRIYGLLRARQDNDEARRGLRDFHTAHISTLDSFCARIARIAARRYGIRADFAINDGALRKLARDAALPFVLDHRDNAALQLLMADRKIRVLADELFAGIMVAHSPISKPLDFNAFKKVQGEELLRQWDKKTGEAGDLIAAIREELEGITKKTNSFYRRVAEALTAPPPAVPDIRGLLEKNGFLDTREGTGPAQSEEALRREISRYFAYLYTVKSQSHQGGNGAEFSPLKENLRELRDSRYGELESLANMALQSGIVAGVFPLVEEFQGRFNRLKREAGLLSFQDIAHLAVDALARYPDIRRVYKDRFRAIMIDEFQDNNRLQRDLIFLLAENPDRMDRGIPRPDELCPDKLFFVGDEKQSIYRFRGADVSVFRSLARTLSSAGGAGDKSSLALIHNYRSKPFLIGAFNVIFGGLAPDLSPDAAAGPAVEGPVPGRPGVFLPPNRDRLPNRELADFEAVYRRIYPSPSRLVDPDDRQNPPVCFCFLDEDRMPQNDPRGLSAPELEAAFIAARIREMVDSRYPIEEREGGAIKKRPCGYGDFAILQRSYTHQTALEKQCKAFNIPFTADKPAGLFTDAPINDLYNLLRLLVYPADRIAYAALIRSPFMRLSDLTLSVCMLHTEGPPFDEALDSRVPPEELARYREARSRYRALAEAARILPLTGLLTKLWYAEGYRYETTWSASSQIYGELFDLFFELARTAETQGETLTDFVDYLEDLMGGEEKLDDQDVPVEGLTGVRIMSIHKSKGLEFPVVFVYHCSGRGAYAANPQPAYFSEKFGITVNLPQAEELPEDSGNYFFNRQKEEEAAKNIAELRRLLYVAMTRAESALFLTATLPKRTAKDKGDFDPEDETYTPEAIKERLTQLYANEAGTITSFFDLLLPVLASLEDPPFSIQPIPVVSRRKLREPGRPSGGTGVSPEEAARATAQGTAQAASQAAAAFYAGAALIAEPPPVRSLIPASSLRYPGRDTDHAGGEEEDDLSRLLKKAGLDPADFGTLVHGFVEARFTGEKPALRPLAVPDEKTAGRIEAAAREMGDRFFASDLGRRSLQAAYRETEFPIITWAKAEGKIFTITGKIDLLFEWEGAVRVVDFKTDRIEDPDRHLGQLAAYARAAGDIFGKPVRSWLFFFRTGTAVELTAGIQEGYIEKLLAELRRQQAEYPQ